MYNRTATLNDYLINTILTVLVIITQSISLNIKSNILLLLILLAAYETRKLLSHREMCHRDLIQTGIKMCFLK